MQGLRDGCSLNFESVLQLFTALYQVGLDDRAHDDLVPRTRQIMGVMPFSGNTDRSQPCCE